MKTEIVLKENINWISPNGLNWSIFISVKDAAGATVHIEPISLGHSKKTIELIKSALAIISVNKVKYCLKTKATNNRTREGYIRDNLRLAIKDYHLQSARSFSILEF